MEERYCISEQKSCIPQDEGRQADKKHENAEGSQDDGHHNDCGRRQYRQLAYFRDKTLQIPCIVLIPLLYCSVATPNTILERQTPEARLRIARALKTNMCMCPQTKSLNNHNSAMRLNLAKCCRF